MHSYGAKLETDIQVINQQISFNRLQCELFRWGNILSKLEVGSRSFRLGDYEDR